MEEEGAISFISTTFPQHYTRKNNLFEHFFERICNILVIICTTIHGIY